MKAFVRAGAVALALLVLLPVLAVAGGQGEAAKTGEKMTITWMSRYEDPWAMQEASRLFGVNIVSNHVYVNDRQKREIMIAAGEWPDCGPAVMNALDSYNQGVTRAIPVAMIKKYAPNYAAMLDRYPIGWLRMRNPDNDQEMLIITGVATNTTVNMWYPQTRIDWIRNVGKDLPDYDAKKVPLDTLGRCYFLDTDVTIDWLEDLLYAFRDGDHDKDGKTGDVVPMGASSHIGRSWQPLLGAFGVSYGGNRMIGDKLYPYQIDPGFKEFLLKMADWYKNGLIDKEFPTLNFRKHWDKIATQQVAFSCEQLTYAGQTWAMNRPPNTWVPDDEIGTGAEVVMFWPPVGPNGDQGSPRYGALPVRYDWVVYKQVSDEKLAKILQVINWRASKDGFVYYQAGKPGVHFDWEGEPWNSRIMPRKEEDIPSGYPKEGPISVYPPFYTPERLVFINPPTLAKWYTQYALSDKGQKIGTVPYRYDFLGSKELRDINEMYGETLSTMFTEMFFKGITGQVDVAAEWDSYVDKWLKAGGSKLIAATEKLPLTSGLIKGKIEY